MQGHESFQEFAHRFGSRNWLARDHEIGEMLREPLQDAIDKYAHGLLPEKNRNGNNWVVAADVLDLNSSPNAFVTKHKDIYCIGMPYTTAVHFYRLTRWLFKDPKLFPFASDKAFRETGAVPDRVISLGKIPPPLQLDKSYFDQFSQVGSTRHLVADWVASKAIELVWHHEFGHIIYGHIDYELSSRSIRAFSEATSKLAV